TVATTWLITESHLGTEARAILRLASFLAPAPIPRGLWACDVDAFRDAIARLAPGATANAGDGDAADRGMAELADYSLATLTPDSITFHRLVLAVERDQVAPAERHAWLAVVLRLLDAAAVGTTDDVRNWLVWNPLVPHLTEALAEADAADIAKPTARLMSELGLLLRGKARWSDAEPLHRRALAIVEASFGPAHPEVGIRLNNLALLLQDTNRLADAEPLLRRALAIDETAFGPNHPEVATDLN